MNCNRRFLLAIFVVALAAVSVPMWRSQAATGQGSEPPGATLNAQAEASAVVNAVPGGPGFVSMSALGFTPWDPSATWAHNVATLYNPSASTGYSFHAPLVLPQGARVTKFVVYFFDSDTSNDLFVYLGRCPLDTNYCLEMALIDPVGDAPGSRFQEDVTIWEGVIDNQSYAYVAEVFLPPSPSHTVSLIGVRVDYSYPVNLPLVMKEE